MREPCQQRQRGEEFDTGGSQFNRQWQSIQPSADRRDGRGVLLGQVEIGLERLCPLHKERDRRVVREVFDVGEMFWVRQR